MTVCVETHPRQRTRFRSRPSESPAVDRGTPCWRATLMSYVVLDFLPVAADRVLATAAHRLGFGGCAAWRICSAQASSVPKNLAAWKWCSTVGRVCRPARTRASATRRRQHNYACFWPGYEYVAASSVAHAIAIIRQRYPHAHWGTTWQSGVAGESLPVWVDAGTNLRYELGEREDGRKSVAYVWRMRLRLE